MKTFLQTLFFFLLVTQICSAQLAFWNDNRQSQKSFELPTETLNVNIDSLALDSIITAYRNSQSVPGIATLIIKDNKVIWNKNYGYRNLELRLPVEDSTLFFMGSISKTIIATAIMQLWEKGMIELNNNINDYLPASFTVVNPRYPNDSITVKMLMTHTSSIQDNWSFMDYLWDCGDYSVPYDSFLVNYFTPNGTYYSSNNFYAYAPGQNRNYTNAGVCLLALIVEHLTGKSFNEYTKDSIFTPLSMQSSSWFLTELDTNKIATPYENQPPVPMCHTGIAYWPIGQLRTNKFELSNFLSAYMNGGIYNNNKILKSNTIQLMLSDQLAYQTFWGGRQGLIWWTLPMIYNSVWGHDGEWYGANTIMFCNPSENWSVIFFINCDKLGEFLYTQPVPQMAQYAHLYDNIYATSSYLDKTYARKNIDSVLFRTRFSNIQNHQFIPNIIFINKDSTQIDSLILFDDGLHGDSFSRDGIYGGYIPPQQTEDFYTLGVSTIDNQTNKYFNSPDQERFTTAGPVTLDSIRILKGITNYYNLRPFVRNQGSTLTITKVKVRILCDDPWVSSLSSNSMDFPNLAPGMSVGASTWKAITYIDSIFPGYFNFKVEVSSDGWTYWVDSTKAIITGIAEETNEIPTEYSLAQNYPNPFNPSTKIIYTIPLLGGHERSGLVTLKVYDILGREVVTLVNEYKQAGKYETEFNAEGIPSGVYFYQLKAGDYINTKKMILLR